MINCSLFHHATARHGESTTKIYEKPDGFNLYHVEYDSKTWAYHVPIFVTDAEFIEWAECDGFAKEFDDENGNVPKIFVVDVPKYVEGDSK